MDAQRAKELPLATLAAHENRAQPTADNTADLTRKGFTTASDVEAVSPMRSSALCRGAIPCKNCMSSYEAAVTIRVTTTFVQHHTISAVHRLSRHCTLRAECESDFPITDRGSITFRCLMS